MCHVFGGSVYLQGRHTFGLLTGLVASASLHLVLIFAGLSPLLTGVSVPNRGDRLLVELRSPLSDLQRVFSDSESQIDKPPSLQGSQSMEPCCTCDGAASMFQARKRKRDGLHSLTSAIVNFGYENTHVHLIDTPGYPDFAGQAIAALAGVDTRWLWSTRKPASN
jgi:hypothetical protein